VTTNFKLNDALLLINSISYISFGFGRSVILAVHIADLEATFREIKSPGGMAKG